MFQWRFQFQTLSIVSVLNFFPLCCLWTVYFDVVVKIGLCSRTARPDGDTRNPRYTRNPRNAWTTRATRRVFTSMEAVCLDVWARQGWQGLWSCSRKEMLEGKTWSIATVCYTTVLCVTTQCSSGRSVACRQKERSCSRLIHFWLTAFLFDFRNATLSS